MSIKKHLINEFNRIQGNEGGDEYSIIDDLKNEYDTEDDSDNKALKRCGLESL